jgi:multidrug efflux pump subunit AcrB
MSYFLTRTLVPTMVHFMLKPEVDIYARGEEGLEHAEGFIWQTHHAFNRKFERMRLSYRRALGWSLQHRGAVLVIYCGFVGLSLLLVRVIGTDFFPYIDSGQIRLHVRTPEGTRIEQTEEIFSRVEADIRQKTPPGEVSDIVDNIGLPDPVNLSFGDSASIGSSDGDILVSLDSEHHRPTELVQRKLRAALHRDFPDETFFFTAANMTNQILNFGIPAPIDVQLVGRSDANYKILEDMARRIAAVPGAVDVHINQEINTPSVQFDVDRSKASEAGLTQRDVANSMLISLSSSGQTAPNQWVNPLNGVQYTVAVQTPQYRMDSIDAIGRTPITGPNGGNTQLLDNLLSGVHRGVTSALINHYNVQPVFDIYANTDQRDLGGVAADIEKIMNQAKKTLPRGSTLVLRGQVLTMETSFRRLGFGIVFAILLVYLLMVVNFQSWLDPFIILTALPGAFAGILWMLYATQTTLNVPSLMGSIMAIGVATANSILLVTFANDERAEGKDEIEAALSAGYTRIRPVLMTALAMIIGMLPMAFSLGEGGEQNAPLGRAVIGGLIFATFSTLFFVPIVYSFLRKKPPVDQDLRIEEEEHEILRLEEMARI